MSVSKYSINMRQRARHILRRKDNPNSLHYHKPKFMEQLSSSSKQRQLLVMAGGKMVCQKCDLPSSLFNSAVSHRYFLPPPYNAKGGGGSFLKCAVCKGTELSELDGLHLRCSWTILTACGPQPSDPQQRGGPGALSTASQESGAQVQEEQS